MNSRIEQEINKTLECIDGDFDITPSASFADNLTGRLASVKISRGSRIPSGVFYSVIIVLLVVLNISIGLISYKSQQSAESSSPAETLAAEYSIANSYGSF